MLYAKFNDSHVPLMSMVMYGDKTNMYPDVIQYPYPKVGVTDGRTNRQAGRQAGRQTDGRTDERTDRQRHLRTGRETNGKAETQAE